MMSAAGEPRRPPLVPAQAGTQGGSLGASDFWTPAYAGVSGSLPIGRRRLLGRQP